MLVDFSTGKLVDHPGNADETMLDPGVRVPHSVAEQIMTVVPDPPMKAALEAFAFFSKDMPPDKEQAMWAMLAGVVGGMVPKPPLKLEHEWQVKAVAILMNKPEDFIKKYFYEEVS